MHTPENKNIRLFTGIVVSDRMTKTITVKVDRSVMHPVYKKRYKVSKKFHVHDPQEKYHVGDSVTFQPCRPLSRSKRWIVIYDKA